MKQVKENVMVHYLIKDIPLTNKIVNGFLVSLSLSFT